MTLAPRIEIEQNSEFKFGKPHKPKFDIHFDFFQFFIVKYHIKKRNKNCTATNNVKFAYLAYGEMDSKHNLN
ncbi:hypothetical protein BLOT_010067 [Blomia tropicalis]|nr:hypothetical protein BLOT_010067 [Blomia tropicalis]